MNVIIIFSEKLKDLKTQETKKSTNKITFLSFDTFHSLGNNNPTDVLNFKSIAKTRSVFRKSINRLASLQDEETSLFWGGDA